MGIHAPFHELDVGVVAGRVPESVGLDLNAFPFVELAVEDEGRRSAARRAGEPAGQAEEADAEEEPADSHEGPDAASAGGQSRGNCR